MTCTRLTTCHLTNTLPQAVVSKYVSKQMQCSPQEEICYMEYSQLITQVEKGIMGMGRGQFLVRKVDVTWCLNPTIREGTQRAASRGRIGEYTPYGSGSPLKGQLQTCFTTFRYSLENANVWQNQYSSCKVK